MMFFILIRNSLINTFLACAFIALSLADIPERLTLEATSGACSVIIRANGSIARVEVVSNVSMTTIQLWNGTSFAKSLSFSTCNTPTFEIQLINSNASFKLYQNKIQIQAINMSASCIKFQNGTFFLEGSVFVPESSVIVLDHATLKSAIGSVILLKIQGKFLCMIVHSELYVCCVFSDKLMANIRNPQLPSINTRP
jgi:hypothetical protein